jgi:anti-sigma28 factor (negative regulator of flagellin synthesis)
VELNDERSCAGKKDRVMAIDKVSSFLFARSIARQGEIQKSSNVVTNEPASTDSVIISQKSRFLRELNDRRAKVEDIKRRIDDGSYEQPSSGDLARSVVGDMG